MRLLHITNGTAIVDKMRHAGIKGRIVPWNDVLHEGPVPDGLNTAALRDVRAQFIAAGFDSFDEVSRSFAERDAALQDLDGVDEVVLWLEHDLYDQLQLVQILDQLPMDRGPLISAVPGDDYLGTQPTARFAELFAGRRPVTSVQRVAARDAWHAFRSSNPRDICEVIERVTVLPHLGPALQRHLQQFPSFANGLSRTEQQTLEALTSAAMPLKEVYIAANHDREEAVFMGDLAFQFHLRGLWQTSRPLIAAARTSMPGFEDTIHLTDDGRRVLGGEADRVTLCGIDRWLGGVHLSGHGPLWRWDPAHHTVRIG
jgi:hypothetical protein